MKNVISVACINSMKMLIARCAAENLWRTTPTNKYIHYAMNKNRKTYCLEIRGDYACFTRPELKVERVSYDVPTPSALRNIFSAIFWKPSMRWHVRRIEVLNPIVRASVKRNEVGCKMAKIPFYVDEKRQQRTSYVLRDVAYRVFADLEFIPVEDRPAWMQKECKDPAAETPVKYFEMFERRASKGQCFMQPYLGCREFSCSFELLPHQEEGVGIDETRPLGIMLYDLDYIYEWPNDPSDQKLAKKKVSPNPVFYDVKMEHGVIIVPDYKSEEVLR